MDGADRAGEAWQGRVSEETNEAVDIVALGSEVRGRIARKTPECSGLRAVSRSGSSWDTG